MKTTPLVRKFIPFLLPLGIVGLVIFAYSRLTSGDFNWVMESPISPIIDIFDINDPTEGLTRNEKIESIFSFVITILLLSSVALSFVIAEKMRRRITEVERQQDSIDRPPSDMPAPSAIDYKTELLKKKKLARNFIKWMNIPPVMYGIYFVWVIMSNPIGEAAFMGIIQIPFIYLGYYVVIGGYSLYISRLNSKPSTIKKIFDLTLIVLVALTVIVGGLYLINIPLWFF